MAGSTCRRRWRPRWPRPRGATSMMDRIMPAERAAPAQLLVDLSVLVQKDDHSGIQRVVRNVLAELTQAPPAGYRVVPVYDASGYYAYVQDGVLSGDAGADGGAHDHGSASGTNGDDGAAPAAAPDALRVRAGDIFFGLDLAPKQVPQNAAALA